MTLRNQEIESPTILYFLILSLTIHTIFIFLVKFPKTNPIQPEYKEIELRIDSLVKQSEAPAVKKIIVPESDIEESKEFVNTPFLASKNTVVKTEQIKRGDSPDIGKTTTNAQKQNVQKIEKNIPAQTSQRNSQQPTKDLKEIFKEIETATINRTPVSKKSEETRTEQKNQKQETTTGDLEARLNALAGVAGNPDVLDNIRDGQVTLLNAKADRFAVFVRRVALQVFNAMRASNWYEVGDISAGFDTGEVTFRATLDKTGKYVSHEILTPSGTPLFDKVISQSVRKGAWDKNPPQSALTPDGYIKFIFQSKAYVRGSPQGRSRQWIQLGTGLE